MSTAPHIAVNAHLMSPEPGFRQAGVSRYIAELLQGMWRSRPDLRWTVYCPPGVSGQSFRSPPPPSVDLQPSRLPTTTPAVRLAWEQCLSPALLAVTRPDVLLAPLNVIPILAPCPTVVVVHDLAFLRLRTHRLSRRRYLSLMTGLSVRRARHVVTVSEFTRREVIDLFGVPGSKVTAIPNGLAPDFAPPTADDAVAFRRRVGLPDRYLLFVGTLEPRKNLPGLIRAYAAVRDRLGMPLVIVGGRGWMNNPLFDLVHRLGLGDQLRFEGFVSDADLPLYYGAATALAYPSLYEGFGLPPLEAMAAGTPVVTTRGSSLGEVVGDAALLVNPGDDAALAQALVRIVHDEPLRQQLRSAGFRQAATFRWERTADATLAVLLDQVSERRRAPAPPPALLQPRRIEPVARRVEAAVRRLEPVARRAESVTRSG